MLKTVFFITLFIFTNSIFVVSQVTQDWVQTYNGPGNSFDYPSSIVVDVFGNVSVTGASWGIGTSYDFATIQYNAAGVQRWVQRYNSPGNHPDEANSMAVDLSGNVYVTGADMGSMPGYFDFVTIKYNTAGVQQWQHTYDGGGGDEVAYSIAVDLSGNVYVTGVSISRYATIKYNSAGIWQWFRTYFGPGWGENRATSIALDSLGNVYVTGLSFGTGMGKDFATIKYNSSGDSLWVKRYNGPGNGNDEAYAIAVDKSGNVYVTGYSAGNGTNYDFATIKYNTAGVLQWVQRYNGPGNGYDRACSIAVDGTGNVYVTGYSAGSGTHHDFATIKYNTAGVQQWVQRYNGPGNDYDKACSIAVDGTGNVYVTGQSTGSGTGDDFATIKYNTAGVQQWVQRYSGTGNGIDKAYSIAVDGTGNVYVTGESNYDYATIKYSQSIGIRNISNEIPEQFKLHQNYPNPFNPETRINFAIPKQGFVNLKIYDLIGREVKTLMNETKSPGSYSVDFNASDLSSGVYFYKIQAGEFTDIKKMTLIK